MFNHIYRHTCVVTTLCLCVLTSTVSFAASNKEASVSIASLSEKKSGSVKEAKYETIEATVNINSAGADEIAGVLKGIGKKRAQKIVAYREKHGKFTQLKDISNVSGISQKIVERNSARILF